MANPISDLRRLRGERIDWLLTVLTGVLALLITGLSERSFCTC